MKVLKILAINVVPVFVISLLIFALRWFIYDWNVGVITAIYQLKTPLDGTNPGLIIEFCEKCVPVPAILAVGTGFLCYSNRVEKGIKRGIFLSSVSLGLIIIGFELKAVELDKYLINLSQKGELFEKHYTHVDPEEIIGGENNLILIYAESMEITYASKEIGGGKPKNLIPNLTNNMKRQVSFSNQDKLGGAKSMPGTDWTMGGIFSSMTGTPLKLDLTAPNVDLNKSFCPNITAIGDILSYNGYTNYFQCGSDAIFGGRKAFFLQHGNYNIYDYYYAVEKNYISSDYHVFWGYEDKVLFDIAKKELTDIGEKYLQKGEKFNYTMLTVDTHHPSGFRCELCEATHKDGFADIISCSDRQISEFLEWVENQEWSEDTTIVVIGDHPSMVAGFWVDTDGYENKPINLFVNFKVNKNNNGFRDKNRLFAQFDLTPTILEGMGFEVPNHTIGLGVSLFSNKSTLMEEIGQEKLKNELCKTSDYYNKYILQ